MFLRSGLEDWEMAHPGWHYSLYSMNRRKYLDSIDSMEEKDVHFLGNMVIESRGKGQQRQSLIFSEFDQR